MNTILDLVNLTIFVNTFKLITIPIVKLLDFQIKRSSVIRKQAIDCLLSTTTTNENKSS